MHLRAAEDSQASASVFGATGKLKKKEELEGKIKRALAGALSGCPSSQKTNVRRKKIMCSHIGAAVAL